MCLYLVLDSFKYSMSSIIVENSSACSCWSTNSRRFLLSCSPLMLHLGARVILTIICVLTFCVPCYRSFPPPFLRFLQPRNLLHCLALPACEIGAAFCFEFSSETQRFAKTGSGKPYMYETQKQPWFPHRERGPPASPGASCARCAGSPVVSGSVGNAAAVPSVCAARYTPRTKGEPHQA